VKGQRDTIVKLGPQGTCPTCKRRVGPEYAGVLTLLDAQLEVITVDGKYFRQRLEQLAQPPAKLLDAEAERDRVLEESRRATARAGELRAQVEERDRASAELAGARRRAGDLERRLTARPAGYDPARRSEEHTSELQSRVDLVCRLLLEKKNKNYEIDSTTG